ncbi:MAG: PQQ-binding-like beta-propeller repeat protein [Planctomycetaceae bacterium]
MTRQETHRPRRTRATLLLLAVTAWHPAVAADGTPQTDDMRHGPVEQLRQKLVQSSVPDRLLSTAVRQLESGQRDSAFRAIRVILAEPTDSFTRLSGDATTTSVQRAARDLLLNADAGTRREWVAVLALQAESELQQAIRNRDLNALRAVSRSYPLTQAALQSLRLQFLAAVDRGDLSLAEQLLTETEESYGRNQPPFDATAIIKQMHAVAERSRTATLSRGERRPATPSAGSPYQVESSQLSPPWTKPLWSFSERFWDNPAAVGVLSAIANAEQPELLSANTWQPLLLADRILFRSPLRIVCFDRRTGRIDWSLPTDTGAKIDPASIGPGKPVQLRTPVDANSLLQMEQYGTMSGDRQFVYFIDGYRAFDSSSSSSTVTRHVLPGPLGGQLGNQFSAPDDDSTQTMGHRLVAVGLSPVPRIAWTAGEGGFRYEFNHGGGSSAVITSADDGDSTGPFSHHRFLGVPLIHGDRLLVITSDGDTLFLNAVSRSSGRLCWRQPLSFDDTAAGGRGYLSRIGFRTLEPSALCGVFGNSVICSLPDGIVVAASITDGQLLWATNTADPTAQDTGDSPLDDRRVISRNAMTFRPVIFGDRIFHAAPESQNLTCLDAATGTIQWQVPRRAVGTGAVDGSADEYAVGGSSDAVILIGQRHIRAVEADTGVQMWVTELPPQTGRAVCGDRQCLVPLRDGTIAGFDLSNGRRDALSRAISRDVSSRFVGSLAADSDVICAATPVQLTVIPATTELRRRQSRLPAGEQSDAETQVSIAKAELLSGDGSDGVQRLLKLVDHETSPQSAHTLLAETLLYRLAKLRYQNPPSDDWTRMPQNISTPDQIVAVLRRLKLTREQSLRTFVLAADESPAPVEFDAPAESTMLHLLPDWHVRADVAAWAGLSFQQANGLAGPESTTQATLQTAAHAVSFPSHIGSTAQQLQFAESLVQQHRPAAAEMFLLAAERHATGNDAAALLQRVQKLRTDAGVAPMEAGDESPGTPADGVVLVSMRESLQDSIGRSLLKALAEGLRSQVDTPAWYDRRLLTSSDVSGAQLSVLDMHAGAVIHRLPLPVDIHAQAAAPDRVDSPGLLPLIGMGRMGMLSLVGQAGPEVLWHKRLESDSGQSAGIITGPIGPDFFIWKTQDRLNCAHPLTGGLLWSVELSTPPPTPFGNAMTMTGDEVALAVFGSDMRSYRLYQTQDGRHLRDGHVEFPPSQTPVPIGRRLLFVDEHRRIRLVDLLTEQDVLTSPAPLRITEHTRASLLPNGRVATITEDRHLVVIDGQNAVVELQIPLPDAVAANPYSGLVTFERAGRLYVLLRNFRNIDPGISATPLLREPRLDFGILLCIDSTTRQLLWSRESQPAVVPPIYGDATDLLLLWSIEDPGPGNRVRPNGNFFGDDTRPARSGRERSLKLQIVDSRTGHLVAEQSGFHPYTPLRCVHDAATKQIRVETERSVITVACHVAGE